MAKSNSILALQGTVDGMTYVVSKRYKAHVRKARSSGPVNEVFKENNRQVVEANNPALLIKNVVDIYRQDFIGGMLWQRLVGHFKRQKKENKPYHVTGLNGMEIHDDYYLDRLLKGPLNWSISVDEEIFNFSLNYTQHPDFKRKYPDAYSISAIIIFPDFEAETAEHFITSSDIISLNSAISPLAFTFPLPLNAAQYVIVLKLQAYEKGKICEGSSVKGMKMVATGDIERNK